MRLEINALSSLPEIRPGSDLAVLIRQAASAELEAIDSSVIVAVAQKIVSKAENAIVDLRQVQPSPIANAWASRWGKDPRLVETILSQSRRIVKMDRGVLIAETHHGFVCANAGVDQSNTESDDFATILPDAQMLPRGVFVMRSGAAPSLLLTLSGDPGVRALLMSQSE
jgi:coenzyme F420-0:L-glutamate ligase/coenzyme F420-1:gamma-L-glutamate ligase